MDGLSHAPRLVCENNFYFYFKMGRRKREKRMWIREGSFLLAFSFLYFIFQN